MGEKSVNKIMEIKKNKKALDWLIENNRDPELFYVGYLCRQNHNFSGFSIRYKATKACVICRKVCDCIFHKNNYQKHKLKRIEQVKKRYKLEKEKILNQQAEYRKRKKERISQKAKEYRERNKEQIKEYQEEYRKSKKEN